MCAAACQRRGACATGGATRYQITVKQRSNKDSPNDQKTRTTTSSEPEGKSGAESYARRASIPEGSGECLSVCGIGDRGLEGLQGVEEVQLSRHHDLLVGLR